MGGVIWGCSDFKQEVHGWYTRYHTGQSRGGARIDFEGGGLRFHIDASYIYVYRAVCNIEFIVA